MKNTQSWKYIKRAVIFIVLALATVAVIIFAIGVYRIFHKYQLMENQKANFCTSGDEVFNAIKSNYEGWLLHFSQNSRSPITFSTESGLLFTALEWGEDLNEFFVVTEYDYPHTFIGLHGYWYSATGVPKYAGYSFTQLGEGIYCYR